MNPKDINKLTEKFFSGETNEKEEAQLRAYVFSNEIPEQLLNLKKYFEAMDGLGAESIDHGFEERLFAKIDGSDSKTSIRRLPYRLISLAATVLILIALWFGSDLFQPKEVYGTIDDPVMAFQETKKALDEVSKKMNKGLTPAKKTVDKVEDNVQKASEIKKINKALEKTKNINKLDKTSDFLKSFNKVYVDYGNS